MPGAEVLLWTELRGRRLGCRYRRQHPLGGYVVDFACLEHRVAIECDGIQHDPRAADLTRDVEIEKAGFVVMRFWNSEIYREMDLVLSTIGRHTDSDFNRSSWHPADRFRT